MGLPNGTPSSQARRVRLGFIALPLLGLLFLLLVVIVRVSKPDDSPRNPVPPPSDEEVAIARPAALAPKDSSEGGIPLPESDPRPVEDSKRELTDEAIGARMRSWSQQLMQGEPLESFLEKLLGAILNPPDPVLQDSVIGGTLAFLNKQLGDGNSFVYGLSDAQMQRLLDATATRLEYPSVGRVRAEAFAFLLGYASDPIYTRRAIRRLLVEDDGAARQQMLQAITTVPSRNEKLAVGGDYGNRMLSTVAAKYGENSDQYKSLSRQVGRYDTARRLRKLQKVNTSKVLADEFRAILAQSADAQDDALASDVIRAAGTLASSSPEIHKTLQDLGRSPEASLRHAALSVLDVRDLPSYEVVRASARTDSVMDIRLMSVSKSINSIPRYDSVALATEFLGDAKPEVRSTAVNALTQVYVRNTTLPEGIVEVLQRVAEGDPSATTRQAAKRLLEQVAR